MNREPFAGGMGLLGRLTHAEEEQPFSLLSGTDLSGNTGYRMSVNRGVKVPE